MHLDKIRDDAKRDLAQFYKFIYNFKELQWTFISGIIMTETKVLFFLFLVLQTKTTRF